MWSIKSILLIFFLNFLTSSVCGDLNATFCDNINTNNAISTECKKQMLTVCNNSKLLWRLFDASSKYPISGLSWSDNKDFGNYPECVGTEYNDENVNIKGKICSFSAAVPNLVNNALGLKTVPNFTLLTLCVPDACMPSEIGALFGLPQALFLKSSEEFCMTKDTFRGINKETIAWITVFAFIFLIAIIATVYDIKGKKNLHPVLMGFSMNRNTEKIFKLPPKNNEQIDVINGLRFISMCWVIAGHSFRGTESSGVINRDFGENFFTLRHQYISSAPIAVDTFFLISGFVSSYIYLKVSKDFTLTKHLLAIPRFYLHRYIRLTPALAAIFFCTITFYRNLGDGPLWPRVVIVGEKYCRDSWLPFFLYYQNYYVHDKMCLNQTWFLSADFQMHLLSVFLLIPMTLLIKKHFKFVIFGLLTLSLISTVISLATGLAIEHNNDYETHTRLNEYIIGLALGAILREKKDSKFPFSKTTNIVIWIVVFLAAIAFNVYYVDVVANPTYTKTTYFQNLYKPIWCGFLCWLIYSCHKGHGSYIGKFLSLPIFAIGSKLTYSMYLLHGSVIAYFVGVTKTIQHFSDYYQFYLFCGHFGVVLILSYFWTLLFESPFITIEKWIFGDLRNKKRIANEPVVQATERLTTVLASDKQA